MTAMSPLVDLVGLAATTPLRRTSRPSVDSLGPEGGRSEGAGAEPVPVATMPVAEGRISSWPYGSASGPVTSRTWPRDGGATPLGQLDDDAAGRIRDRQERRCSQPTRLGGDDATHDDG